MLLSFMEQLPRQRLPKESTLSFRRRSMSLCAPEPRSAQPGSPDYVPAERTTAGH